MTQRWRLVAEFDVWGDHGVQAGITVDDNDRNERAFLQRLVNALRDAAWKNATQDEVEARRFVVRVECIDDKQAPA